MAKIPVKPVIDIAKTYGSKATKFMKNHWKDIGTAVETGGPIINEYRKNRKEKKDSQGKIPFRKGRYIQYKKEVLMNLADKTRSELFQYKLEVKQYIQQIKNEEERELVTKKPIHKSRLKNWNEVLIQIEDRIATRDYHEYLMIFNNPDYESPYFKDYLNLVDKFKRLMNSKNEEDLYIYVSNTTNKSISEVMKDFI